VRSPTSAASAHFASHRYLGGAGYLSLQLPLFPRQGKPMQDRVNILFTILFRKRISIDILFSSCEHSTHLMLSPPEIILSGF
jgi:hypothetical protein